MLLGATGPMLIGAPSSVVAKDSSRPALSLLGCGVLADSLFHFVCPLVMSPWYQGLETRVNAHGVCFQSTSFICGPAAGVTALNRLGVQAEEGELAPAAFATPLFGMAPDRLYEAIERLYNDEVQCEYRPLDDLTEIGKGEVVVSILKYNVMVGHYVGLLKHEDGQVVLGDPSYGLERMSADEFQADGSGAGIAIRKKEPTE